MFIQWTTILLNSFPFWGHFGVWPIRTSWFCFVFPSVVVNYLGQGAFLLHSPSAIENPFVHLSSSEEQNKNLFFSSFKKPIEKILSFNSLVGILANVNFSHNRNKLEKKRTEFLLKSFLVDWKQFFDLIWFDLVIASQAIITGCFSLLSQATSLGYCPQLRIEHTSSTIYGQIYVPVRLIDLIWISIDWKENPFLTSLNLDDQLDINVFNNLNDSLFSKFISINECLWINCLLW